MSARLQIVIEAMNLATDELKALEKDLKDIDKRADKSGSKFDGFKNKIKSALSTIGAVTAGAVAFGFAAKKAFDLADEGAALQMMDERFASLTDSIGSTSKALLDDLRGATRGLVSDAELVASASDFMALGLANSHDEVVRLATVAGALNMNMNQLVLTLTNQTTMRFDALGVSVAGFDEKVDALKETGLSASDAFGEAFLQQAEEQIMRVGEAADSSAAEFLILKANAKNFWDETKKRTADTMRPAVKILNDNAEAARLLRQAYDQGLISAEQYRGGMQELNTVFNNAEDITAGLNVLFEEQAAALLLAQMETREYADALGLAAIELEGMNEGQRIAIALGMLYNVSAEESAKRTLEYAESAGIAEGEVAELTKAEREAQKAYENWISAIRSDPISEIFGDTSSVVDDILKLQDAFARSEAGGGAIVDTFGDINQQLGEANITSRRWEASQDALLIAATAFDVKMGDITAHDGAKIIADETTVLYGDALRIVQETDGALAALSIQALVEESGNLGSIWEDLNTTAGAASQTVTVTFRQVEKSVREIAKETDSAADAARAIAETYSIPFEEVLPLARAIKNETSTAGFDKLVLDTITLNPVLGITREMFADMAGFVGGIKQTFLGLDGQSITVFLDVIGVSKVDALAGALGAPTTTTTSRPAPPKPGESRRETGAVGLDDFIVPFGNPLDSFPVMAQSGERVTVRNPADRGGEGGNTDALMMQLMNLVERLPSQIVAGMPR